MTLSDYIDTLIPHVELASFIKRYQHLSPDSNDPMDGKTIANQCVDYLSQLDIIEINLRESYHSLRRRKLTSCALEEVLETLTNRVRTYREELSRLAVTAERLNT